MRFTITTAFMLSAVALPAAPPANVESDQELKKGIYEVREGEFAAAVATLDAVALRLGDDSAQRSLLARVYLYRSAAHLGLRDEPRAKADFLLALRVAPTLKPSPEEFPPKFIEFWRTMDQAQPSPKASTPPMTGDPSLVIVTVKPAADLTVDGTKYKRNRRWVIALTPGSHDLLFSHSDYEAVKRTVTTVGGENLTVHIDLAAEAAAARRK